MPEEWGQHQVSAANETGPDLVHFLSVQITVVSAEWERNRYENEQEREHQEARTEHARVTAVVPFEASLHTIRYSS